MNTNITLEKIAATQIGLAVLGQVMVEELDNLNLRHKEKQRANALDKAISGFIDGFTVTLFKNKEEQVALFLELKEIIRGELQSPINTRELAAAMLEIIKGVPFSMLFISLVAPLKLWAGNYSKKEAIVNASELIKLLGIEVKFQE